MNNYQPFCFYRFDFSIEISGGSHGPQQRMIWPPKGKRTGDGAVVAAGFVERSPVLPNVD